VPDPAREPLTPAQQETLEQIRPPAEERPTYRSTLRLDLLHRLEGALVDVADDLDDALWVSKRTLQAVHGCEASHEAEQSQPFEYTVPTARGQVFHKAVELSVHLGAKRHPLELVDEAVASLMAKENKLADFLQTTGEIDRAELRSECGALVTAFLDTFPPLRAAWRPTTESPRRVPLLRDKIVLFGRFDLTLGGPVDTTAGRVILELKTGRPTSQHQDDLRFYALLETLVTGVPPLLVASFYVDAGRVYTERVDEPALEAAVRRTIDGVQRLAALRAGEVEPRRVPGPPCRWCSIAHDCEIGARWMEEQDEASGW
jgi:hypothetical protein